MNLGGAVRVNKSGIFCLILIITVLTYYYTRAGGDDVDKANNANRAPTSKHVSLRTLLAVAIKAAKIGGIEVVAAKDHLMIRSKGKTKEGANDSYTTADINSHCSMSKLIRKFFPDINLISEERRSNCDDKDVVHIDEKMLKNEELFGVESKPDVVVKSGDIAVWIDPLDATQEYTEHLYQYVTTMVCVAVNGEPTIGVIHNPFENSTYWAWTEKGTSKNLANNTKEDVQLSNKSMKILISRSHAGEVKAKLQSSFPDGNLDIISAGGAGYKVIQVATKKADAYVHVTAIKKWDICAGNAILNALGGRLSTKMNGIIDYSDGHSAVNDNGLIATLINHKTFVGKI